MNDQERKSETVITYDDIARDAFGMSMSDYLDQVFQKSGLGYRQNAVGNHFYGFNHRHLPTVIPHNTDHNGYVFFTRPRLNLTASNIVTNRKLTTLLTDNPKSIGRIVRNYLDPVIAKQERKYPCPFVDPWNVFMPLLSNSLISMTPPPSTTVGTYTTGTAGAAKEVFSMIDDIVVDYSVYTTTATFRNLPGNPFLTLFYCWMLYASLQFLDEGPIPYPDDINNFRMNYTTRYYHLVMDASKRYVQAFQAPMYAFPISIESGSIFTYDINKPMNEAMKTLDIQFQCVANIWNDPILIEQFNTSVALMNPSMSDRNRKGVMVKVPYEALVVFNGIGYPRINPDTWELEWWVTKEQYQQRKGLYRDYKQESLSVLRDNFKFR